jgi:Rrf2 family protein
MQITARGWCAVRAMVAAARSHADEPIRTAAVAQAQNVAITYLYGIISDLRRAGLIHTYRGSGGGFRLACPPDKISVGDVLRAIDGALSGTGQRPCDWRQDETAADVDRLWRNVHTAVTDILDHTTIADVVSS